MTIDQEQSELHEAVNQLNVGIQDAETSEERYAYIAERNALLDRLRQLGK